MIPLLFRLFSCRRCVGLVADVQQLSASRDFWRHSYLAVLVKNAALREQIECQRENVGFAVKKAEELRAEKAALVHALRAVRLGAMQAVMVSAYPATAIAIDAVLAVMDPQ